MMITPESVITALVLPVSCRVDRRIPKKILLDNTDFSARDRRRISEDIKELRWLAVLKPGNTGIPGYQDDIRTYREISVLSMEIRKPNSGPRLNELVHRAIPYPILLIYNYEIDLHMSVAHKRSALNEAGKVIIDGDITDVAIDNSDEHSSVCTDFMANLTIEKQKQQSMFKVYQSWSDTLIALRAAYISGQFKLVDNTDRRLLLDEYESLTNELKLLQNRIRQEGMMARKVELNLQIKGIKLKLSDIKSRL